MPYSTVILVRNALYPGDWDDGNAPDSSNLTNTAADLSNEQLQDAIAEADSIIDGYLGALYTVPVIYDPAGVLYSPVPHPLDYWSRDLAAYYASLTYRGSQDFTDNDPIARRYNATMTYLKAVAAGTVTLPFPANSSATAGEGAGSPVNAYYGTLFAPSDFSLRHSRYGDGFPWGFGGDAYLSQLDAPWPT